MVDACGPPRTTTRLEGRSWTGAGSTDVSACQGRPGLPLTRGLRVAGTVPVKGLYARSAVGPYRRMSVHVGRLGCTDGCTRHAV